MQTSTPDLQSDLQSHIATIHAKLMEHENRLSKYESNNKQPDINNPDQNELDAYNQSEKNESEGLAAQQDLAKSQMDQQMQIGQQQQNLYGQVIADQQQKAQQIKELGNLYPHTSYAAIEKNMSATKTAMKYAAFAFGALGSAFNGGNNVGVESYYKSLQNSIDINDKEYNRHMDQIEKEHGSTLLGIQTKINATQDQLKMVDQMYGVMDNTLKNTMQMNSNSAERKQKLAAYYYTKQQYEMQATKYQYELEQMKREKNINLLKMVTDPSTVNVKDPQTGQDVMKIARGEQGKAALSKLPQAYDEMQGIQNLLSKFVDKEGKLRLAQTKKDNGTYLGQSLAPFSERREVNLPENSMSPEELENIATQAEQYLPKGTSFYKGDGAKGMDPRVSTIFSRKPDFKEAEAQKALYEYLKQMLDSKKNQYNRILQQNSLDPQEAQTWATLMQGG